MKTKKKKMLIACSVSAVLTIAAIIAYSLICIHSWSAATCETPATCEKCGKTQGEPLGHEWIEATCTEPRHCMTCGITEGATLEHNWKEATCEEAKVCLDCGETEGEPLGHSVKVWSLTKEASCSEEGERSGACRRCGKECKESIDKLPHTEKDWERTKDYVFNSDGTVAPGVETKLCEVCGEEIETREITVNLSLSQKNAIICAYDEINFWHCGPDFLVYQVLVDFNGFTVEDAKFAVSHMSVDWDEQAVLYARQNCMGSSKSGLSSMMQYYGFSKVQIVNALQEVGY